MNIGGDRGEVTGHRIENREGDGGGTLISIEAELTK